MKITCTPGRGRVPEGSSARSDVLVTLEAPVAAGDDPRAPICVVPVVDVSGSMAGAKLAAVKAALRCLIDHLLPGDRLGLVSFADQAHVLLPVEEVGSETKKAMLSALSLLRTRGCTNLGDGLTTGMRLAAEHASGGRRARVIALTDGKANRGAAVRPKDLVSICGDVSGDVSVSAFGYGGDCDHHLLAAISDVGGGSFAYIETEDDVLTAFGRELGGLSAAYAADVRVRAEPSGAVSFVRGPAATPSDLRVGDLLEGGAARCLFSFDLPAMAEGRARVCSVEVSWRDIRGELRAQASQCLVEVVAREAADLEDDEAVAREVEAHRLKVAQKAAEAAARRGDFEGATRLLAALLAELTDPGLRALVQEVYMPAFRNERSLHRSAPARASSLTYLRGKRQVKGASQIEELLGMRPGATEAKMEALFKKHKRSS